ncbi:MAG: site-specific integrase, partial [Candidatus Thermoplasmatota archaeon]
KRILIPFNKAILSSPVFKSPKNYIDNWRWKVENSKSNDALFLQPNGRRITGKYVRSYISPAGKKIAGKYFHLYTMRHTFATYLYNYTKDIKFVSKMLGHTKINTTNRYVHIADCMTRQLNKKNLFNLALRSQKIVRVKQDKIDCWGKYHQSKTFSPVGQSGLGGI